MRGRMGAFVPPAERGRADIAARCPYLGGKPRRTAPERSGAVIDELSTKWNRGFPRLLLLLFLLFLFRGFFLFDLTAVQGNLPFLQPVGAHGFPFLRVDFA